MASSLTRKQCANNDGCKQTAVTNCEGCSTAFCIKHFNEHRRLLDEEMNLIIDQHDHLKNTLNQQITKPDSHPLIKEIDEWEKESIAKIQNRAKELRQELLQSTATHMDDLSKKLQWLSLKLKESRENENFIETDLQDWKKTLSNLKTDLFSPSTISIKQCDNASLVYNIAISLCEMVNDIFERVSDNGVCIEESGKVIARKNTRDTTEVRGKNEYSSGRHEILLHIEQSSGTWMFLGINSKITPIHTKSFESKSSYGWSSNNYIWLNGKSQLNNLNSRIEMKTNDIIALNFDCDNGKISMISERTKAQYELFVNIDSCPFPWQLHVNLHEPNSRIRILET